MRFIRAKFKNFCQHEERQLELHPGLNCIKGSNGAGKSNLLNGLVGAVTGSFSRNFGAKADNIRDQVQTNRREKSFVEADIEHNDVVATIYRGLRPNKHKLTIPGEGEWEKDGEIKRELTKFLGVSEVMLLKYVFVEQWKMFDFLSVTPTERAKAFASLFNTDKAERIWKAIGERKIDIPQPPADVDVVRQRLVQTQESLASQRSLLAEYDGLPETWNPSTDADQAIFHRWQQQRAWEQQRDQLLQDLEEAEQARERLDESSRAAANATLAKRQLVEISAANTEKSRAVVLQWSQYNQYQQQLTDLRSRQDRIESDLTALQSPPLVEGYVDPEDSVTTEMSEKTMRQRMLQEFVKKFDPVSGVSECPTCGTATTQLASLREEYLQELGSLDAELKVFSEVWDASRQYDRDLETYRSHLNRLQASRQEVTRNIEMLPPVERPVQSLESAHEVIRLQESESRELARLVEQERQAAMEFDRARLKHESWSTQYQELTTRLAGEMVSQEDAEAARVRVEKRASQYQKRGELRGRVSSLERSLRDDEQLVEACRLTVEQAKDARAIAEHLDQVRAVFHRDSLPRLVAHGYLSSMQGGINELLESWESPFRIDVDENLQFMAHFVDGKKQPAERLSGGEMTIFAMAYRVIINSMFASELGCLFLDEPTAGLDERNLSCLKVALSRLRELSTSRGLQVVMVTHEKLLDNLFDQVIDLSQPT